jgi:hypothetical protein
VVKHTKTTYAHILCHFCPRCSSLCGCARPHTSFRALLPNRSLLGYLRAHTDVMQCESSMQCVDMSQPRTASNLTTARNVVHCYSGLRVIASVTGHDNTSHRGVAHDARAHPAHIGTFVECRGPIRSVSSYRSAHMRLCSNTQRRHEHKQTYLWTQRHTHNQTRHAHKQTTNKRHKHTYVLIRTSMHNNSNAKPQDKPTHEHAISQARQQTQTHQHM